MYVYTCIEPPSPFSSSILLSYFAIRLGSQHLLPYLKYQKVSFFPFDLSPTIRIFFFSWFLSLRPVEMDIQATASRYEKKTADLPT